MTASEFTNRGSHNYLMGDKILCYRIPCSLTTKFSSKVGTYKNLILDTTPSVIIGFLNFTYPFVVSLTRSLFSRNSQSLAKIGSWRATSCQFSVNTNLGVIVMRFDACAYETCAEVILRDMLSLELTLRGRGFMGCYDNGMLASTPYELI